MNNNNCGNCKNFRLSQNASNMDGFCVRNVVNIGDALEVFNNDRCIEGFQYINNKDMKIKKEIKSIKERLEALEYPRKVKLLVGGVDLAEGEDNSFVGIWKSLFEDAVDSGSAMAESMRDYYTHSFSVKMPKIPRGGVLPTDEELEIERLKAEVIELKALNENKKAHISSIEKERNSILSELSIKELQCVLNLIGKSSMDNNYTTKTQYSLQLKVNKLLRKITE